MYVCMYVVSSVDHAVLCKIIRVLIIYFNYFIDDWLY